MDVIQTLSDAGLQVTKAEPRFPNDNDHFLVPGKNILEVEKILTNAGFTQANGYKSSTGTSKGFYDSQGKHVVISQPKSRQYFRGTFVHR